MIPELMDGNTTSVFKKKTRKKGSIFDENDNIMLLEE